MKRILYQLLLIVALIAAPIASAQTVSADHGGEHVEWYQSSCNSDVWYYEWNGGWVYWTAQYGQYWVGGGSMHRYAAEGWECGWMGPPTGNLVWHSPSRMYYQPFQGGYTAKYSYSTNWFACNWYIPGGGDQCQP